jgi:hypothetical protein
LLIWMFFLIHLFKKPFRKELKNVNLLETLSSLVILTSFFFSALFFNDINTKDPSDYDIKLTNYLLYYGIYLANISFFIYAFRLIYHNEKPNIKPLLREMKGYILFPFYFVKRICKCIWSFFKKPSLEEIKNVKIDLELEKKKHFSYFPKIIELNPLAQWDNEKPKGSNTAVPKSKEEILVRSYEKKIKMLKLCICFQKDKIKRLKKMLRRENPLEEIEKEHVPLNNINNFEETLGKKELVIIKK